MSGVADNGLMSLTANVRNGRSRRIPRIGRPLVVAMAAMTTAALMACAPPNPGPSGLYLGKQASIHPTVTPKGAPITWGSAPPIDPNYGATLYAGTAMEQQDPRPARLPNGKEPLRMWMAQPDNGVTNRPAIVWLHGGGFTVGIDSMYGLADGVGKEYAQRGYVSFSAEYRTDTTLLGKVGDQRRPRLCQYVQDHQDPGNPQWESLKAQCLRNIQTAQRDVQAAVRWIRAHAAQYGVDPDKIAVGGFSAGAVTAANLAYRSYDVGGTRYFAGDDLSVAHSRVQAAIGASGCLYSPTGGPLTDIGSSDAPISFIQSRFDASVPYDCAAATVTTARAKGLVAELTSYCLENGHAMNLYRQHQAATDAQWTTFLARELGIYSGMPPATTAPVCPGSS